MKTLLSGLVLAISLIVSGASAAEQCVAGAAVLDAKNGFRDVRLGTPISEIEGLRTAKLDSLDSERFIAKGVAVYERPSDDRHIFGQPLTSIRYWAFEGRVFFILLRWSGFETDEKKIFNGFEAAFDCEPESSFGNDAVRTTLTVAGSRVWFGAQHLMTKFSPPMGEAKFVDVATFHRVQAAAKAQAREEF